VRVRSIKNGQPVSGVSVHDLQSAAEDCGVRGRVYEEQVPEADAAVRWSEIFKDRTFAMIKPDAITRMGQIISEVQNQGFIMGKVKLTRFTRQQAINFYAEHRGKAFFEGLINFITSDFVVGMELVGHNAVEKWRSIIGPTNAHVVT